jgi:hypothetical protein
MADALGDALEVFAAPLDAMIVAVAKGVSDAQRTLDHNSVTTQAAIDADPAIAGLGLQATWYQFPRVDAQFKVSMTVTQSKDASTPAPRFYFSPVSASFQNHFNYAAEASSQISFAIVPIPPPNAAAAPAQAHLSVDEVRAAALAAPGVTFAVVTDPQLGKVPDPKLRFDVNFSPTTGMWSVIQYNPLDSTRKPAIVIVDDRTKAVRVLGTP